MLVEQNQLLQLKTFLKKIKKELHKFKINKLLKNKLKIEHQEKPNKRKKSKN